MIFITYSRLTFPFYFIIVLIKTTDLRYNIIKIGSDVMYCNKCNNSLKDDEHICPKCGFDNDATIDLSSMVRRLNKREEKKSKLIIVIILLILLCIGVVVIYLLNGSKEEDVLPITSPTTASKENTNTKAFKFNDISLEYPSDIFTKKENTLLYNNNNNIFIEFATIDANEYNDQINGNECLDYKLNELLVKTFAKDNSYSYLFMLNDQFYNITINYINDPKIYTEAVQIEISHVLNTIKKN